jgi:hypothetical protein
MMKKFLFYYFLVFCFLLLGGAGCFTIFLEIVNRVHMGQQTLEYPRIGHSRIKTIKFEQNL